MHDSRLAGSMRISNNYKSVLPIIVLLVFFTKGVAQPVHSGLLKRTYLEYVNNLPKYLLNTKSAVVLIAPTRAEAVDMANEIHPDFVRSGIDAVAYYHVDDLFVNEKMAEQLSANMDKREIKYMIVLEKDQGTYRLVITAHEENTGYLEAGNKAYKIENKELRAIGNALYSQAYSMERQNFLIIDNPEFPPLDVKMKGRRYEAYRPDLKTEKLVFRYFKLLTLPDSTTTGEDIEKVRAYIATRNAEITEQNRLLDQVLASYPYPYELVDANITDKELNDEELRYVMQVVHTTNSNTRDILGFSEKTDVTEYVSVTMNNGQGSIKRIPATEEVYKYYVHHIPSESNYLGTKWDADITWQQALKNYLQLMKAEID